MTRQRGTVYKRPCCSFLIYWHSVKQPRGSKTVWGKMWSIERTFCTRCRKRGSNAPEEVWNCVCSSQHCRLFMVNADLGIRRKNRWGKKIKPGRSNVGDWLPIQVWWMLVLLLVFCFTWIQRKSIAFEKKIIQLYWLLFNDVCVCVCVCVWCVCDVCGVCVCVCVWCVCVCVCGVCVCVCVCVVCVVCVCVCMCGVWCVFIATEQLPWAVSFNKTLKPWHPE